MSGPGHPGKTHCGSWVPTEYEEATGWVTRLVCVREPHGTGRHRSRTGHTWGDGAVPTAADQSRT